jgi:hypothetical protein
VQERPRRSEGDRHGKRKNSTDTSVFGSMAKAGAAASVRSRDLPKLIPLWPHELVDQSLEAAATCWRSSAKRSGPSEGALYRVTGAMTSIGISA